MQPANVKTEQPSGPKTPALWPFKRVFYGWAIVVASFTASFGEVPVNGPVIGVFIKPMREELGWSTGTIALGFMIGSIVGALSSALMGWFVDRYGARFVVVISGLLIAAALVGLSTIQEPWHFWVLFGLGRGAALAGVGIGTSVALGKWFYRRRARVLAVKGIGHRTGQVVFPIIIVTVMSVSDWRMAFLVSAGIVAVLVALPALLYLRKQPEDMGLMPDGVVESELSADDRKPEVSWTLQEARRTRAFWLIVAFTVGTPFVLGATNLHLVANFQDRGFSDALAVSVLSIFAAISALSMMPMGLLLERIHVRHGGMIMTMLLMAAMLVISVADSYWEAMVFALLFGLATGMRGIIETLLIANYFGRGSLGTIRGFARTWTVFSTIGPVFGGYTRDFTGSYTLTFLVFAAAAGVMFLLMVFAKQPVKPAPPVTGDSLPGD
jgi:MFS family permease